MTTIRVDEEVAQALFQRRPVVALESAVVTCGLPRDCGSLATSGAWDDSIPANLQTARLMSAAVRDCGAVPALIAVVQGVLRIGLDDESLIALAGDERAGKVSSSDLAAALTAGVTAGTTVSATLLACGLAGEEPISTFATGGIGGVHRGWTERPDVSADLRQLARSSCAVVTAGAKSVLDVAATLEVLESLGVTVIGYRTDRFPQFYSRGSDELRCPHRIDDVREIARLCHVRWQRLAQPGAVVVAQAAPESLALQQKEVEAVVSTAVADAGRAGVRGKALTPYLLTRVAERTSRRSMAANVGLLEQNARLAAELAVALCE